MKTSKVRTLKRKVKRGLKIAIDCRGSRHKMYLTPKGHLVIADHTDKEMEEEMAMVSLAGADKSAMSRCAAMLQAWRHGNQNLYSATVPYTANQLRKTDQYGIAGSRLWDKYSKKIKYLNKHIKRQWFTDDSQYFINFIKVECGRVGLQAEFIKRHDSDNGYSFKIALARKFMAYLKNIWPITAYSQYGVDAELKYHKPGKLSIKADIAGLRAYRIFDKTNFDMAIKLLGQHLMINIVAYELKRFEQHKETAKIDNQLNKLTAGHEDLDVNCYDNHITLTLRRRVSELLKMPYMVKELIKLLELMNKARTDSAC